MSRFRISSARAADSYSIDQNTRSRRAASMPSSSATSAAVIALLLSGALGRARRRDTGSPVSHC